MTYFQADTAPGFSLGLYDRIIVYFSGGKDSLACLLWIIQEFNAQDLWGVVELEVWHHDVDGCTSEEEVGLFDWPCTPDYCRKVVQHCSDLVGYPIPLYFSWIEGGLEREMFRQDAPKARTFFESPDGLFYAGGNSKKTGTRMRYPQQSPDLTVRWCSPAAKINVADIAINNQPRFLQGRTLTISGERAEESGQRSRYEILEPDRTDSVRGLIESLEARERKERDDKSFRYTREQRQELILTYRDSPLFWANRKFRWVDRARLVKSWTEAQVWDIIQHYGINPHPAYRLGWGRTSCMTCIFGSDRMWATLREIAPAWFYRHVNNEQLFESTIARPRKNIVGFDWYKSLEARADRAEPYSPLDPEVVTQALSREYYLPIYLPPDKWQMPMGAFGENNGPT